MKFTEKLKKLTKFAPVVSFLALEVFAILAFSLGNNFVLFGSLSLALFVILLIFSYGEVKREGLVRAAILIIPLLLYTLFIGIGIYSKAHIDLGDFSVASIVFVPLGLISIAMCGYFLSLNKSFKFTTFLTVVYSGIALLVLLNLIVNMINFGPCYSIIYKNCYMYYGGKRSDVPVSEIAYALEGFKFIEVKMEQYVLFPIILATSSYVLLHLKYKDNKPKFIAYIGFTALSIISLILVPSLIGLIYFIFTIIIEGLIILYTRVIKSRKIIMIFSFILLGLAGLVVIVMIFNNQSFAGSFHSFISNNAFLNKVFNTNRYVAGYNKNLTDILCTERFFGFCTYQLSDLITDPAVFSGSILFDNFMTSGVLGVVSLIAFFIFGLKGFKTNAREAEISYEKSTAICLIVVYLLYSLFCGEGQYGIFYKIIRPTYMSSMFLLVIFALSYFYFKGGIKNNEEEI